MKGPITHRYMHRSCILFSELAQRIENQLIVAWIEIFHHITVHIYNQEIIKHITSFPNNIMVYAILKFARFNSNKRTCNNCIAYATKFARQLTILLMKHTNSR